MNKWQNPCATCTRVQNPDGCENKNCKEWKAWFLRRWGEIHRFGRLHGIRKKG